MSKTIFKRLEPSAVFSMNSKDSSLNMSSNIDTIEDRCDTDVFNDSLSELSQWDQQINEKTAVTSTPSANSAAKRKALPLYKTKCEAEVTIYT